MKRPIVIKQDINFLDKPLWFVETKHDGRGFVWKDIDGYEYRTGYNVPDKIDGLILLYLMWKSQKMEFQEKLVLSRYEVLKACDLQNNNAHYYKRLEESLKRWKNVAIEFKGTFYDGEAYKSYLFGILDEAKIRESDGQLELEFNKSWLIKIKENQFFKYINFEYCKLLRRPVSMRLYELLSKNYKGRNECYFKLTTLGTKLTLSGRTVQTRSGVKEVIYASDVLVAIKPAIKEVNKLAQTPDILEKTGILPEDLFTLSYEIKGKKQDRVIYLTKHPVFPKKAKKTKATEKETSIKSRPEIPPELQNSLTDPEVAEQSSHQQEKKTQDLRQEQIATLLDLLKQKSEKLREVIINVYEKQGFDYIFWNIRYANETAKYNYSTYLQKALAENWAYEWALNERNRQKEAEQKKQNIEKEKSKTDQLERERNLFCQKYKALPNNIKFTLMQKAEQEVPSDIPRREMEVKFSYANAVRDYLNEQGENFTKEVVNLLSIVHQLVAGYS